MRGVNDLRAFAEGLAERLKTVMPEERMAKAMVTATHEKATIDILVRPPHMGIIRLVVYASGPVKIGTMNSRKLAHFDFHRVVSLWGAKSVDRIIEAVMDQMSAPASAFRASC